MARWLVVLALSLGLGGVAHGQAFRLAPAVAIEAEEFVVESRWMVVRNGHGNYMVDAIGFNHISGERLLSLPADNATGRARREVRVPVAGKYRLWVRYEYPPFCETRFRVVIEQNGRTVLDHVMGTRDSLRHAFGDPVAKAQHDPPWGPEGLVDEVVTVPPLQAGPATLWLVGVAQPQTPGVAANRNIDLLYLTSDTTDAWRKHYARTTNLYPILDAFRDSRGARWEVRFTNRSDRPADYRVHHVYNRIPWGFSDPASAVGVPPGARSGWLGLTGQDTAHFGLTEFRGIGAFDVELRPVGGDRVERTLSGTGIIHVYLPPYPDRAGDQLATPEEAIDAILADLKRNPAPGQKPTLPLCYGGWLPLGQDNAYGRKYAELYAALGFRSLHPAHSGPAVRKNLEAVGIGPSKSWMVMGYRNPPTRANIDRATRDLDRTGMRAHLRFFDYGDEIAFAEWLGMQADDDLAQAKAAGKKIAAKELLAARWVEWLKRHRPRQRLVDYWLPTWGPFTLTAVRPDSSAEAARLNPRLYVDSLLFYEESAIRFAAEGAKAVRAALGDDVLCGANYSCHPFYYPHSTMYIKWFRDGAADLGRHSEYFWQVGQLGPMVNGYVAEHFRAGMRDNPRAVLRQYTMPHAPGNTDASFLRSAFTHLAHGATMLDFFGIGLNETFTENHIDHRAIRRFRALRAVTHAVGFVEDQLPQARAVPSSVALLVSASTERWDLAAIATDRAGHAPFGPDFRKTRLHFHLDRLGIWQALTFLGCSPDLVTEDDVLAGKLKGYRLLVLVGDHWPRELPAAVEKWVREGGIAIATAGAGARDPYGDAIDGWRALAGLKEIRTEPRDTFLRPRQELPFLTPLDTVAGKTPTGEAFTFPALATQERLVPADAAVLATGKKDGAPLLTARRVGRGQVLHLAAHPGLAYLYTAAQPPAVPDRGPGVHRVPAKYDSGVATLFRSLLDQAGIVRPITASHALLDARLLESPGGYLLPVANYHPEVGQTVKLTVRVAKPVAKVVSAYHGELKHTVEPGQVTFTLPTLGYGDIVRLRSQGDSSQ